jgi:transposase
MYIDVSKRTAPNGKTYKRALLRDSYRENGKVKHHTIANLSSCSESEIEAMKLALRHKNDLIHLGSLKQSLTIKQGLSVGAVWLLYDLARQRGIAQALGPSREGKLALWQVIARVIDQGSRLSAVRLAQTHAACDILDMGGFDEDDLYENLDWLCENQSKIEDRLFRQNHGADSPSLFLYDVTSTYLEGCQNELAAFGYNRDGKKGKLQLVVGLLCDQQGTPLSIEVFKGNLQDPKTLGSQITKVAARFGGGEVTFVGDRGMIKSKQITSLFDHGFHYITAITKPQIEKLLTDRIFEMSLFDEELAEVITDNRQRYILRRNPMRAQEIEKSRADKLQSVSRKLAGQNAYLKDHPRASVEVARRKVTAYAGKLKIDNWVKIDSQDRQLMLTTIPETLEAHSKLDGCYVLKTDLTVEKADKQMVHDRYKDLALVEWAFRESKTTFLELRPVNVRKETRTRGHVLVVMLAYLLVQWLSKCWSQVDKTVAECIAELTQLCADEAIIDDRIRINKIPEPRPSSQDLLDRANVKLPAVICNKGVHVATRVKLTKQRKTN